MSLWHSQVRNRLVIPKYSQDIAQFLNWRPNPQIEQHIYKYILGKQLNKWNGVERLEIIDPQIVKKCTQESGQWTSTYQGKVKCK